MRAREKLLERARSSYIGSRSASGRGTLAKTKVVCEAKRLLGRKLISDLNFHYMVVMKSVFWNWVLNPSAARVNRCSLFGQVSGATVSNVTRQRKIWGAIILLHAKELQYRTYGVVGSDELGV